MKIVKLINTVLNRFNVELIRYPSVDTNNRMKLLKIHQINKILDIGANKGSFGVTLRQNGYKGKILSFEPLSNVYNLLFENSKKDDKWTATSV